MNTDYIMKLIEPHLNGKELTYEAFDKIFNMMSRREQYAIADILATKGIELTDEFSCESSVAPKDDDISDEVFNDDIIMQISDINSVRMRRGGYAKRSCARFMTKVLLFECPYTSSTGLINFSTHHIDY